MDSSESGDRLLVASRGLCSVVRVVGRGSFKNAPSLKRYATAAIEQGCNMLVIDMGECGGLDSTFMGVMAGLSIRLKRINQGRLIAANLSAKIAGLLSTLGLDRLVETHREGEEDHELAQALRSPVEGQTPGHTEAREQVETMLDAHRELTNVAPENVARFADVIAFLEQDLQQLDGN